eukprot:TRINITY_DN3694_c0_g1_i4.p2 TRINITY_DN3694_c0_g1~~TRINITY_DN3694_c0_g1_i4.p2  ORF type:complete len:110 (+),score=1.32 TRINITY_DN3694_c0_g1_i4:174-503(+)
MSRNHLICYELFCKLVIQYKTRGLQFLPNFYGLSNFVADQLHCYNRQQLGIKKFVIFKQILHPNSTQGQKIKQNQDIVLSQVLRYTAFQFCIVNLFLPEHFFSVANNLL